MQNTKQKQEIFNQLFKKGVHKHNGSKDQKFVDVNLEVKDSSLKYFFDNQYNKYKKGSYSDFISECIYWSWKAICRFEIQDEGTWEGIIDGTDQHNLNRLRANIKVTVRAEAIRFMNKNMKYTTKRTNGEVENIAIKLETASLDSILVDSLNEETLLSTLAEDSNFWGTNDEEYYHNHFVQWFNENKEKMLLNSQIKLLEDLVGLQKIEGYTKDDVEEKTGIPSYSVATRLKRINERVLKQWNKENPLGAKGFRQLEKEKELHMWHELIYIAEDESDLLNQNQLITDWVVKNFDNTKLADLIYINAESVEESKQITKIVNKITGGKLPAKTIYKLVNNGYKRIEELNGLDFSPVQLVKSVTEADTKESEVRLQEAYVFDGEGTLLRIEGHVPAAKSKTKIVTLTPEGMMLDLN